MMPEMCVQISADSFISVIALFSPIQIIYFTIQESPNLCGIFIRIVWQMLTITQRPKQKNIANL